MDAQKCFNCHKTSEDMLTLACTHDLCLPCASHLLHKQRITITSQNFHCQICKQVTVLEVQAIKQLQKIGADKKELLFTFDKVPFIQQPIRDNKKIQKCNEHQEEPMYVCFDCKKTNICAECILTNYHKNHNIKTYKKTMPMIRQIKKKIIQQIQWKKEKAKQQTKQVLNQIEVQNTFLERIKVNIRDAFQQFRDRLLSKQRDLIQHLQRKCYQLKMKAQNFRYSYQKYDQQVTAKMEQLKKQNQLIGIFDQQKKFINNFTANYIKSTDNINQNIGKDIHNIFGMLSGLVLEELKEDKIQQHQFSLRQYNPEQRKTKCKQNQQKKSRIRLQNMEEFLQKINYINNFEQQSFVTVDKSFRYANQLLQNLQTRQKFFK